MIRILIAAVLALALWQPSARAQALIYGNDAVSSPPTVNLPTATNSWFTNGNGTSIQGTQVPDYWTNKIGGELNSAITAAPCSATVNMTAYNQISACLQALVPTFTPVQQGGGTGQGANKLNLGWDNAVARLRLAVDGSDQGDVVLANTLKLPQSAAHVSTTAQGVVMSSGTTVSVSASFTPTQSGICLVTGFANLNFPPTGASVQMILSSSPAGGGSTDDTYGTSQVHQIAVSVTAGTAYTFTFGATPHAGLTNSPQITARVSYIFVGAGSF